MNTNLHDPSTRHSIPSAAATDLTAALQNHPDALPPKVTTSLLFGMGKETARVQVVFELTVQKGSVLYPQRVDL